MTTYNYSVSYEEQTRYDDEARADADILIDEIQKNARKAKIPIENCYQSIENVFKIKYSYGEYFFELLDTPIDVSSFPVLSQSVTVKNSHFFEDTATAWASIMSFILSIEALFNIIFEVYLKKEISNDKELREHLFRLPLKDKWSLFSSLCTCFSKSLNKQNKGYKSLNRLIKIRNSWAHVNLKDEMRTYFIEKSNLLFATKSSPIIKDSQPLISTADYNWATQIKNDVDTIKSEILNAMKRKPKAEFSKALEHENILLTEKGTLHVDED